MSVTRYLIHTRTLTSFRDFFYDIVPLRPTCQDLPTSSNTCCFVEAKGSLKRTNIRSTSSREEVAVTHTPQLRTPTTTLQLQQTPFQALWSGFPVSSKGHCFLRPLRLEKSMPSIQRTPKINSPTVGDSISS